jgi:DNA polymerase-3 subunit epsilon
VHKKPTGNTFHQYINPNRDVPAKSTEITGLTEDFLKPFPTFDKIVDRFIDFIADDMLVIHNAPFDMSFLNAELEWVKKPVLSKTRVTDTLLMARKKFPGSPASLDALCKRFDIDLSKRDKHGALLDAELLYYVYVELLGGRQRTLAFELEKNIAVSENDKKVTNFPVRSHAISPEEELLHEEFIATIQNAKWRT